MKFDEEKFYHYIGNRLRELRKLRGMSQAKLGKELGVTFQQVQKYESGANRMSIDKAIMVPAVLGISISELLGEYYSEWKEHTSGRDLRLLSYLRAVPESSRPAVRNALREVAEYLK